MECIKKLIQNKNGALMRKAQAKCELFSVKMFLHKQSIKQIKR